MPIIRAGYTVTPDGATTSLTLTSGLSVGDIVVVMVNNESASTSIAFTLSGCTLDKTTFTASEAQVRAQHAAAPAYSFQFAAKILSLSGTYSIQATVSNHTGTTRRMAMVGIGPDSGQGFATPVVPTRKCEFAGTNGGSNPWPSPVAYTAGAANALPQILIENNEGGAIGNFDFGSGEAAPRQLGLNNCEFRFVVDNDGNASQGSVTATAGATAQKALAVGVYSTVVMSDLVQTITTDNIAITEPDPTNNPLADVVNVGGALTQIITTDVVEVTESGEAEFGNPEIVDVTDEGPEVFISTSLNRVETLPTGADPNEDKIQIIDGVSVIKRTGLPQKITLLHTINTRYSTQRIVVGLGSNEVSVVDKESYIIRISSIE